MASFTVSDLRCPSKASGFVRKQENRTNPDVGITADYKSGVKASAGMVVLCVNITILASSFGNAALLATIFQRFPTLVP